MKKLSLTSLAGFFCLLLFNSCFNNDHNISFSYQDNEHYYSMKARFDKNKMRDVERYMDDKIGRASNMSFINTRIDGAITLDDHTRIDIKKSPGRLDIKFNKDENSDEAYEKIKAMCEGLKNVVIK